MNSRRSFTSTPPEIMPHFKGFDFWPPGLRRSTVYAHASNQLYGLRADGFLFRGTRRNLFGGKIMSEAGYSERKVKASNPYPCGYHCFQGRVSSQARHFPCCALSQFNRSSQNCRSPRPPDRYERGGAVFLIGGIVTFTRSH